MVGKLPLGIVERGRPEGINIGGKVGVEPGEIHVGESGAGGVAED